MTAARLVRHHQLVLADPARADGHDATGEPGDCWRTAVACLLGLHPADVPNIVRYHSNMDELRFWLEDYAGLDYGVTPGPEFVLEHPDLYPPGQLFIATGQSPRGDWLHCAIVDAALELVHDPHPSGAGILDVREVELITGRLLWPRPTRLALEAAS